MGRTIAIVTALLAWGALVLQFYLTMKSGREPTFLLNAARYFGYFTIISNCFAALVLSAPLLPEPWRKPLSSPSARVAGATYVAMTAIVYSLLLRGQMDPQGLLLLANVVLHDVAPVLYLAHWLFFAEKGQVVWRSVPSWLLLPVAYFCYVMVRGAIVGHYPYVFLDVDRLGYFGVIINAAGFLAGFAVLGSAFTGVDRALAIWASWRRGRR